MVDAKGATNKKKATKQAKINIAEKLFAAFYGKDDLTESLEKALEILGRNFDFESASVYEYNPQQCVYGLLGEWALRDYYRPYSTIKPDHKWAALFKDSDHFYLPDINEAKGSLAKCLKQQHVSTAY